MRLVSALFLLLWGLSSAWIFAKWQAERQERLDENHQLLATTYLASVNMHRSSSEILVEDVLKRPEIIALFAEGVLGDVDTANLARGKLYRLLAPAYAHLKGRGIQQLHFHTADGHSFLRFHAPDRFGDPLFDIRPSILLANTQKRPTFGFEVGRVNSGFRFVFPLARDKQHLGSVETGVTFRAICEAMADIDPGREYLLVLRKDVVYRSSFADQRSLYGTSPLHDNFLVEDPELRLPLSPPPLSAAVQSLNTRLKEDHRVDSGMSSDQRFSLALSTEGVDWAVSFLPIKDLLGKKVAYVISYTRAPFLADLRRQLWFDLAFAAAAFAVGFWLTLRLLRSQADLQKEKHRLQIITDTIADGLFMMDRQGCIAKINPAFTAILGYQAAEIVGQTGHYVFHFHGDDHRERSLAECPLMTATRQGTEYAGEELFRHKDGHVLTIDLYCKPVLQQANFSGSVTVFRDITERKATEARLREIEHIKSEFLANVSHELRTPMTVFMAAVEHLQLLDKDPEHQRLLDMAEQASQRLHSLVNKLLDFSRIETEGIILEESSVNLRECLNDIVTPLITAAQRKNLWLELEVAPAVPEFVAGDRTRLGQVLTGLIDNAIKFTDRGGVKVTLRRQEDSLVFTVSDTGIGIPENKIALVFERFAQVDGSSTRRHGGTGLGLSIAKRLSELMGGHLSVFSRLGQGSVFTLTLPLKNLDSRP